MNIFTGLYYLYRRSAKTLWLYLLTAGLGIIVMVADNDAGGITTYTTTGDKYGMHQNLIVIGSQELAKVFIDNGIQHREHCFICMRK